MKPIHTILSVTLCLCLPALSAMGQFDPSKKPDPSRMKFINADAVFYPPMTIGPPLLKFLPADAAFTATVEVSRRGPGFRGSVRAAFFKGQTRVDMDIADQKAPTWTDCLSQMEQAGSAHSVSIFSAQRKSAFTVLPSLKAYMEEPISADALAQFKKRPKAQTIELGTEEVAGQVATKTKLIFNKEDRDVWKTGQSPEAIVWTAKDTPGIPLRIEVLNSLGETNVTLVFKELDLKEPAGELFAPPKRFAKCDEEELVSRIMEKWPKAK